MLMLGSPPRAPPPRSPPTLSSLHAPKSRRFSNSAERSGVTTRNPPRITKSRLNLEGRTLCNVNAREPAPRECCWYFRRSHFKRVANEPMSAFGGKAHTVPTHLFGDEIYLAGLFRSGFSVP